VAGTSKLLSCSESGRARTDYCDSLSGETLGCVRQHQPFIESLVDNRNFDFLDGYRWLVDPQNTSTLTRSRAQTAGELWKVVGFVKALDRTLVVFAPDQIIPLRN
jgi:hypothetical protein